jgi:hypothetical protein
MAVEEVVQLMQETDSESEDIKVCEKITAKEAQICVENLSVF